jgi:NAD(P)-dependent dehydrogenase (short-subunit alcohol dehydrogenase family)
LDAAIRSLAGQVPQLDALVNNAAVPLGKPLEKVSLEEWDEVIDSNLRAAFLTVQKVLGWLKSARGAIVNVSSVHALATSVNITAYAASKGGLLSLTRAMAVELAPDGIRANAVLPGAVDTPMLREGLNRGQPVRAPSPGPPGRDGLAGDPVASRLKDLEARTVLGRIGQPWEVAEAILFLADNRRSSFITGQALVVDGGATARLSTE